MHEGDGFSAKTVEKSLFHCKNAAPAMVWPASSDFWKAPLDYMEISLEWHWVVVSSQAKYVK